jgi:signal transduction protein with GAF and PtsI domain
MQDLSKGIRHSSSKHGQIKSPRYHRDYRTVYPSYFNQLHENIRGFVYQKEINKDSMQRYADHFHIPMVTTSYPFINGEELTIDSKKSSLLLNSQMDDRASRAIQNHHHFDEVTPYPIKIYASLSDQRLIHQIESLDTLQGICVYQTEYMYHTKGTIPSVEEFTACFQTILESSNDQEIYIALPNIKPSMSIDYLPNHYLDLELYDEFPALINHLIKGIVAAMKETRKIPKIVVPMIRMYKEVEAWTTIIEAMFEDINSVTPDIGFMIETESALEYHEDFKGLKFAIIGMDNLIEELIDHPIHLESLSFHDIKRHFWQDLKEMHQFFRGYSNQTKHIVMGKSLKNPILMDKLIKAGFQAFALPIQDIPSITPVIKRHIATRGKYKGIHEARKQKNHQNRMVFEE